jgi:hypothetical protein
VIITIQKITCDYSEVEISNIEMRSMSIKSKIATMFNEQGKEKEHLINQYGIQII